MLQGISPLKERYSLLRNIIFAWRLLIIKRKIWDLARGKYFTIISTAQSLAAIKMGPFREPLPDFTKIHESTNDTKSIL